MSWRARLNRIHRLLGRSPIATRIAIALRNQFGAIVAARVSAPSCHRCQNGEQMIVSALGPGCEFFIDVGANVGDWTEAVLDASNQAASGLLFEPNHETCNALRQRFRACAQVSLIEAAAADYEGESPFYAEPGYGRTSSLSRRNVRKDAVEKRVKVTTLDRQVTLRNWPYVSLIKVDAEGHDYYVIRGASDLLERGRVHFVQFEYNMVWAAAGATLAGAFNLLSRFGYHTYMVRPDGLYRFDQNRYGETFAYSNFLSVVHAQEFRVASLLRGNW